MKISVIIPFYNNNQTIERALESIRKQTVQPTEVIVVNDASPDWKEAERKLNKIQDIPLIILHHQENKNGAAARNTGILAAIGDYISFLDADDEWMPHHLENLKKVILLEDPDVLYTSSIVISRNNYSYILPKKHISESKNLGEYIFADNGFIPTPCLLVKKDLAKAILFNPELIRHQDYDFLLRLERAGAKFGWSPEPTVLVHWENNDIDKKGGTWEFSLNWYKSYREYLSSRARTQFILKFVILRNFKKRRIPTGLKYLRFCKPWHLSIKDFYFLASTAMFGYVKTLKNEKNN